MKTFKIIGVILLAALVIIQFVPNERPDVTKQNAGDLIVNNTLPDSVSTILKNACYDCHSNQTVYPWYAYVAPVSWLVTRDTKIGRKHLNFSEWESFSKMDKAKHLEEIGEEVGEANMPMPIYILMHPKAKLKQAERQMLVNWSEEFADSLFD